jgi:preprotein translocase subunit YajC
MSSQISFILIAGSGSGGGAAILQLGILLLIPFAMYFFMIRPQRRRVRDQKELQSSIEIGDDVITTSGIYGKVTGEDGDARFWLEIDDDVQIRISRAAIQGKAHDDHQSDDDQSDGDLDEIDQDDDLDDDEQDD